MRILLLHADCASFMKKENMKEIFVTELPLVNGELSHTAKNQVSLISREIIKYLGDNPQIIVVYIKVEGMISATSIALTKEINKLTGPKIYVLRLDSSPKIAVNPNPETKLVINVLPWGSLRKRFKYEMLQPFIEEASSLYLIKPSTYMALRVSLVKTLAMHVENLIYE
jgi:hypothetical protein